MTTGQGERARPTRRGGVGPRVSWALALLALSFLVLKGAVSAGSLLSQANVNVSTVATVALPTVNPSIPLTPAIYAQQIVSSMSFNDKVAQMLMMDTDGTQLTADQQQMIEQQHVGGAVLFGTNVSDGPQLTQLTHDMQRHPHFPLFIAIDQEGGDVVNRLQPLLTGPQRPGEPEIGQNDSVSFAEAAGAQTATDLNEFGLNVNLAPVVDVQLHDVYSPELDGRLYSTDPTVVANMADAYLKGLQGSGNVIGVIKHFPGLGATPDNPDRTLRTVDLTRDQLDQTEFVPYKKLISGPNVRVIMVTHILLSQIDPQWAATLSVTDTTGLLRQHLGYKGVIITDDLRRVTGETGGDIAKACLMAALAGSDILMGPLSSDEVSRVLAAFNDQLAQDPTFAQRVDQSVTRILTLKIEMGLIPLPKETVTATPTQPTTPTSLPTATPQALDERRVPEVA